MIEIYCGKCSKPLGIAGGRLSNTNASDYCQCPPTLNVSSLPPSVPLRNLNSTDLEAIRQIMREELHQALQQPEQQSEPKSPYIKREES